MIKIIYFKLLTTTIHASLPFLALRCLFVLRSCLRHWGNQHVTLLHFLLLLKGCRRRLEWLTSLNRLLSFRCLRSVCPLFSCTFSVDQMPGAVLLASCGCLVYKRHVDLLSSLTA